MANSAEWKPVPLAAGVAQRYIDTTTDGLLTNGYLQKDEVGTVWMRRRSGLQEQPSLSLPDGVVTANTQLGIMRTVSGSSTYVATTGVIYLNGALNYTFTNALGSIGVWFDQSTVTTVTSLYASNGLEGAYTTTGTFNKITDVNYPANTVNGSAFLNGYLYVMDTKGSIWGTPNQNDFSVWSSTNVVNAWGTLGTAVAIRRYLNEVLAFKSYSVEVFYDAGNSVGSPLLPVQQINIKWGLRDAKSIQVIDDQIFWAGQSQTGEVAIIGMQQFNAIPVSPDAINRLLSRGSFGAISPSQPSYSISGSASFQMGGDKFYAITLTSTLVSDKLFNVKTFAYNINTQEWSVMDASMTTVPAPALGTTSGLGIANSTFGQIVLSLNGQVFAVNDVNAYDQNHVSGNSTQIKYPITAKLRTDNFTGDTSLRKMVSGLRIRADQKSASELRIRWSDDDYQSWSAWRSINLMRSPAQLPGLQGTFTKRAYEISYAGFDPIRVSRLELLIALGDI